MFKIPIILFFVVKGLLISGYFAFVHGRPKKISVDKVAESSQNLAKQFNSFADVHPSDKMSQLVEDLEWILDNDYRDDVRIQNVIHKDIKNLLDMGHFRSLLQQPDVVVEQQFEDSLTTIIQRTTDIRHSKDEDVKAQIRLLGETIGKGGK